MQSRFGDSTTGWAAFGLAICLCFYPVPARSLPAGGSVTAGDATIAQPNPTTLNINQTSNKAIINWKGFNINVNELVKFSQPGSSSVVLNRVVGVDPSSILGHLVANGRVFLVNSNGIYFGPNSMVNAAGVFATTLGIKDSDFLAGKYTFSQDPSKSPSYVINQGQIKVSDDGFVFLVAPGVKNENLIVANLGKVVLASGQQFTVDFLGDGLINFMVEGKVLDRVIGPDGNPLSSAVSNSGTIKADGGQVTLSARASKDIFESVVNNSGVIEAKSLVNRGGVIRLEGSDPVENTGQIGWQANLGKVQNAEGVVNNSGTLDVSAAEAGAAQGQVTLSGELVWVSGTILARGADSAQGGRVLITSTEKTDLTNSSLIDTSGVGNSSASNVVVWSDKDTIFQGTILGRGGEFGGDGGNVEVSGYNHLTITGSVDLRAPNGVTGTLLLDPGTVTICHDTDSASCSFDRGPNTFSDSYINRQLALSDLTISTSNANNQGLEDITFQDTQIAIAWRNSNILTLNAGRNISVLGSITAGPGGTVLFQFGQAGAGGTLEFNDATVPTFNFRGGAGSDTVNFSRMPAPVSIVFPNSGDVENWIGNGGTLTAVSQPNLFWTITGPNAGNVDDGVSTFAFTNFINLTGGTGNDTFAFTGAGNITGNIDGGVGGTNTLNYSALSGPVSVNLQTSKASNIGGTFSNINNLVGSADLDTLTGPNTTNTWTINAANAGNINGVFSFSSIANLVGGSGADNFIFSGSGSISSLVGGPGFDTADFSALASPVTVTLAGATTELVIGNGGTLVGSNTNNTWTVSGTNAGDFSDGVDTVAFTNFINLIGGTNNDTFAFTKAGNITGNIDGGAGGTNTLDYAALSGPISINLQTSKASNIGGTFSNMNNLVGSPSNLDALTGANTVNTWTVNVGGNSGTVNSLVFSNIENLIGGTSTDSLGINGTAAISLTPTQVTQGVVTINYSQFESLITTTTGALTVGGSFAGNLETHSGPLTFAATTVGGNLSSFASGAVTQTGPLAVAGTTLIDAGINPITLANASNDFQGAVTATGSNISLVDANGLIAALAASGSGTLTAGGNLIVSGSTGSALNTATTGTGTTSFGVTSVGSNLTTVSAGAVSQTGALTVTGNASVTGSSISLGSNVNNFGTLTFNSPGPVNISENSNIVIIGTNTANSLVLISTSGSITDAPNTSVTVTNNSNFSGTSIVLGDNAGDTTNFGSLTFNSPGAVNITEDSATVLANASTANSLVLTSVGSITNNPNTSLIVTSNASFKGDSIILGNQDSDFMDFGSLTFNSPNNSANQLADLSLRQQHLSALDSTSEATSGTVDISQDTKMTIAGDNSAVNATLVAQQGTSIDAVLGATISVGQLSSPGNGVTANFQRALSGTINLTGTLAEFGRESQEELVSIALESLTIVPPDILQLDDELKRRLQITEGFSDMRYTLAAIILNFQPSIMKSPVVNILVRAPAWGPAVTSEAFESLGSGSRFGLGSMGLTF